MYTLSHLLVFVLFVVIALIGMSIGQQFGTIGAIIGAAIGVVVGYFTGSKILRVESKAIIRKARKEFENVSTDELREQLHTHRTMTPNLVLAELMLRGEDISNDLNPILELLESEDNFRRTRGYAAFKTGFSYLVPQLQGYSPSRSTEKCKEKISLFRKEIEQADT